MALLISWWKRTPLVVEDRQLSLFLKSKTANSAYRTLSMNDKKNASMESLHTQITTVIYLTIPWKNATIIAWNSLAQHVILLFLLNSGGGVVREWVFSKKCFTNYKWLASIFQQCIWHSYILGWNLADHCLWVNLSNSLFYVCVCECACACVQVLKSFKNMTWANTHK